MFFILLCSCGFDEDAEKIIKELYEELMPKLVKYSSTRLDDKNYAEDIVQEAFLFLLEKYNDLNEDNLIYWIFNVTDNLIKNKNRLEKNREAIIPIINISAQESEEFNFAETDSYLKELLFRELSETEAEFFNTYFIKHESHEEVAKKYNISINASKARKCRIRARVIRILEENGISLRGLISK